MEYIGVIVVGVVTVIGNIVVSLIANRKSTALVTYRLEQLEKKVQAHNNLVDRMYAAEEAIALGQAEQTRQNKRLEILEKKGA